MLAWKIGKDMDLELDMPIVEMDASSAGQGGISNQIVKIERIQYETLIVFEFTEMNKT